VLSKGLASTAIGVVLGAAVAFELTRLMGYLIYKVSPRDPLAFGSATVIIAVASLAACLVLRGVQRGPIQFGALRGRTGFCDRPASRGAAGASEGGLEGVSARAS